MGSIIVLSAREGGQEALMLGRTAGENKDLFAQCSERPGLWRRHRFYSADADEGLLTKGHAK